jgi:hypothetical protein
MTTRYTKSMTITTPLRFINLELGDAQERLFEYFQSQPYQEVQVGNTIICFGGQDAGIDLWKRSSKEIATRKLKHLDAEVDNFVCADCGCTEINICHIVPRSYAGIRDVRNLFMGCEDCNKKDSNKVWNDDVDEWACQYPVTLTVTWTVSKD